jgi:hypothetical protein
MYVDTRVTRERVFQVPRQIAVQFDAIEAGTVAAQWLRERTTPRSYFHEVIVRARIDAIDNALDHGLIV